MMGNHRPHAASSAPAPASASTSPRVRDIGRRHLHSALDALRPLLARASFVAIDTELGGLTPRGHAAKAADPLATVDERYDEHRASAGAFPIVQFGLSIFTWEDADDEDGGGHGGFDVRTLQFPLFPNGAHDDDVAGDDGDGDDGDKAAGDGNAAEAAAAAAASTTADALPTGSTRVFSLEPRCLAYIRAHGFDLNRWIDEGHASLSHAAQRRPRAAAALARPLREDVRAKFGPASDPTTAARLREHRSYIDAIRRRLTTQHDHHQRRQAKAPSTASEDVDAMTARAERFLTLPMAAGPKSPKAQSAPAGQWLAIVTEPLTPFRRFALRELVDRELATRVLVLDCDSDNAGDEEVTRCPWKRRLRLVAVTDPTQREALVAAHAALVAEATARRNVDLIGFTAVIDAVLAANVPIVGHNMLLDLMQCMETFHGPLPRTLSAWLKAAHAWLDGSSVFDTKVLVEYAMEHVDGLSERLEHSALGHVFDVLSKAPFHGPRVRCRDFVLRAADHTADENALLGGDDLGIHQAGYDAYMTGAVFLRVCSSLGVPNAALANVPSALAVDSTESPMSWRRRLGGLRDTLRLHNVLPPVLLRLPGPHPAAVPTPSRGRYVRLALARTHGPRLRALHIQQSLSWALGLRSTKLVEVRYESKTRVLVALPRAEDVARLWAIHRECPPQHGTEQNPMPSLGCVDLIPAEPTDDASTPMAMAMSSPRAATEDQRSDGGSGDPCALLPLLPKKRRADNGET